MKKIGFLLIYLILSIEALNIEELKLNKVTNFSSSQEAQDSIDFTSCLSAIEDPDYLNEVQKLIDQEEFPEGSDLKETALSICQQLIKTEEFQSKTKKLLPQALEGKLELYPTRTLSKEKLLPISQDLMVENFKVGWFALLLVTALVGCLTRAIDKLVDKWLDKKE